LYAMPLLPFDEIDGARGLFEALFALGV